MPCSLLLTTLMLALPQLAAAQAPPVTPAPGETAPPIATQCAPSRVAPEQGTITTPGTTTGQSGAPRVIHKAAATQLRTSKESQMAEAQSKVRNSSGRMTRMLKGG
mgnify:CR=1 FL=1